MRRFSMLRLGILFFWLFYYSTSYAAPGKWLRVEIGMIGTASQDILQSCFDHVEKDHYEGLLIVLNTAGGSLEATRSMVQMMMASEQPVLVWIGPSGAHAGSAGAFITLAAHVAAMAPGTNIGASTPIDSSGKNIGGENSGDDLKKKVLNDTTSFIQSIAEARGRNKEMATSFVTSAISITASEALQHNIIDFIADDPQALFNQAAGKKITLNGKPTSFPEVKTLLLDDYKLTLGQKILSVLSNPNLFYLLFMAGLIGLGFELTHPGVFFPGVAGAICLILALIATSVLPVSYGAAALILVGVLLLVAEAFVPSFGTLGIGGIVAFILGSVFLVDPGNQQGLRVSWWTIMPSGLLVIATFLFLGYLVFRSDRSKVHSGQEGLLGKQAQILSDFQDGHGKVRVDGELWNARGPESLTKDSAVKVVGIDGLTLIVKQII